MNTATAFRQARYHRTYWRVKTVVNIFAISDVKLSAKLLYLYLLHRPDRADVCLRIWQRVGLAPRTCSMALGQLLRLGLIEATDQLDVVRSLIQSVPLPSVYQAHADDTPRIMHREILKLTDPWNAHPALCPCAACLAQPRVIADEQHAYHFRQSER